MEHGKWMERAIAEALNCKPSQSAYNVGAVLVIDSGNFTTGYSRELPGNTHAEECCLLKVGNLESVRGATMYTTMEPCNLRLSGNVPCSQRLVACGIGRVVIGVLEPSKFVKKCTGVEFLNANGVEVVFLNGYQGWFFMNTNKCQDRCLELNKHLMLS